MDYLDDGLAPADRAAFEAHLMKCQDCRTYLHSYRATVELGKSSGDRPADRLPDLPEVLVEAILAARRKS